ncbi:MAG: methionine synthase [Candidatus Asgardarchaeia archaeon]
MRLLTTVIGSYPPLWKESTEEEIRKAIRIAVEDQVNAGVQLISDGQVRTDMITYFSSRLAGFEVRNKETFIVGKIEPTDDDTLVRDFKFVKSLVGESVKIKGIITGPITLIFSSKMDKSAPYKGYRDMQLYEDVALALKEEANKLQRAGVDAIQVDEPIYSVGAPLDIGKKAVETILEDIKVPTAMHVCGKIGRIFDKLLEFEYVDVLSHEFAASPENFDVVSKEKLVSSGKKLGVGCVKANDPTVETVDYAYKILEKAVSLVGIENIVVHPDCGLRMLTRDVAFNKLKVMVAAAKKIEEKYG